MKTDMEIAMNCLVDVFHQYCILNPIDDYLQEGEFTKLMKEENQEFLKKTLPPNLTIDAYIRQLFKKADKNADGKLKFTEWMVVMGMALNEAHEDSHNIGGGSGHCHSHGDGSIHCH